jgi:hypothetical protein
VIWELPSDSSQLLFKGLRNRIEVDVDRGKQIELLARLRALRLNLPESSTIHEQYVHEFHKLLGLLSEVSDWDLNNFRVAESEFYHLWLGKGEPGELTDEDIIDEDRPIVSDEKYCERGILAKQIDGVLILFESDPPRPARPIGFTQE